MSKMPIELCLTNTRKIATEKKVVLKVPEIALIEANF